MLLAREIRTPWGLRSAGKPLARVHSTGDSGPRCTRPRERQHNDRLNVSKQKAGAFNLCRPQWVIAVVPKRKA